jgi:hypothetical protein
LLPFAPEPFDGGADGGVGEAAAEKEVAQAATEEGVVLALEVARLLLGGAQGGIFLCHGSDRLAGDLALDPFD